MIISRRKQPSLPVTPLKIKQTCMERVHSYKYLGVWLTSTLNWSMQVSEVCKNARQQVGILYQKFYSSANTSTLLQLYTWLTSVHIWSTQHLYGIPTNKDLSTSLRECRNLHLWCAPETGALIMSLCFNYAISPPLPAEALRETVPPLPCCQWTYTFPYGTCCTTKSVQISQNTRTLAVERPVTRTNAHQSSFFPHTITLHVEQLTSICTELPDIAFI